MSPATIVRFLTTVSALTFVGACAVDTTTPSSSAVIPTAAQSKTVDAALSIPDSLRLAQQWRTSVAAPITVSVAVSKTKGGVLRIPQLGVNVTIPVGAVDSDMTISMTALAGSVVAFDFEPAGTKFKAPLRVTQDLGLTSWIGTPFDIVYFKSSDDINSSTKKIKVSEVIPVTLVGPTASFDIWHFSGYAVSAGRF
ncbi:MAG: hypothetical protein ABI625_00190 [bacterium]